MFVRNFINLFIKLLNVRINKGNIYIYIYGVPLFDFLLLKKEKEHIINVIGKLINVYYIFNLLTDIE